MAGSTTVGYTEGSGKNIAVYADASGNEHPVGVLEFLVNTAPTLVSASSPLPVTASSLPLPTGAATAANQTTELASLASIDGKVPALGQALAAASVPVVLTAIQVAALTPPAAITGFSTETTLATLSGKVTACNTGAVVISSGSVTANAGTNLNTSALALETGGNLASIAGKDFATQTTLAALSAKVPALGQALATGSVPVVLTAAQLSALTPPAAITGFATETTLASLNGKVTACNTGAVVLATGSSPIGSITNTTFASTQSGVWNITNVSGTISLPTGAATAAKQDTGNTSLGSIDTKITTCNTGAVVLAAGTATVGSAVIMYSTTVGGWIPYSMISAATTNATNIKTSAGKIAGYSIFNTTASAIYVKFYDSASAPTAGSGTPVRRVMVPPNGGVERSFGEQGIVFLTGVGFTITGAAADADTTAVTSGALLLNIDYR